jgi:hypothetical protein
MIGNIAAGLYGVGVTPSTNSYESIVTTVVGSGGTSSITFDVSSLTGYKHLQIRALLRGQAADTAGQSYIRINGVTSDSYTWHGMYGTGSSVGTENQAFAAKNAAYGQFRHTSGNSTAGQFGVGICDILDAFSTTKYKTIRTLAGYDSNGSGQIRFYSGALISTTNAITEIKIEDQSGSGYAQYSHFALYGIKD